MFLPKPVHLYFPRALSHTDWVSQFKKVLRHTYLIYYIYDGQELPGTASQSYYLSLHGWISQGEVWQPVALLALPTSD